MSTVKLICHLERLGPNYVSKVALQNAGLDQNDPMVDFWLGLTCGYDPADVLSDVDKLRLKTWNWSAWKTVQLAGVRADGTVEAITIAAPKFRLLQSQDGWIRKDTNALAASLETVFNKSAALPDGFTLQPNPQVDGNGHPWIAVLSQISSWPGGLNQWTRLCLNFRLPQSAIAAYEKLVAAPVFEVTPPVAQVAGQQAGGPTYVAFATQRLPNALPTWQADGTWQWAYTAPTVASDAAIVAVQADCLTAAPNSGTDEMADLASLQAKAGYKLPDQAGDWTETAEPNLAELFDLPRLLLAALSDNIAAMRLTLQSPPTTPPVAPLDAASIWKVDRGFYELFLVALRDTVNSGIWRQPDESTLVLELVTATNADLRLVTAQLGANEATCTATLDAWKTELNSILRTELQLPAPDPSKPDLDKNPVPEWPFAGAFVVKTEADLVPLVAFARRLETLRTQAIDPDILPAVIASRLAPSFVALGQSAAQTLAMQTTLSVELMQRQVRKRLLLSLLGTVWSSLVYTSQSDFAKKVADAFGKYLDGRGTPSPGANPPVITTLPAKAVAPAGLFPRTTVAPVDQVLLSKLIRTKFGNELETAVPAANDVSSDPDLAAEGLLIPLSSFRSLSSATDPSTDITTKLAGAGVFIRRDAGTAWRMLNYAVVADKNNLPLLDAATGAPLRLHYTRSKSGAYALYRNLPLATGDPLQVGGTFASNASLGPDGKPLDNVAPVIQLGNAYGAAPLPQIEGLQYGEWYKAWVYYIGHGGHLPSMLTDTSSVDNAPWRLLPAATLDTVLGALPDQAEHIKFCRRSGFGAVRLAASDGGNRLEAFTSPLIPDGVLTLSESITLRDAAATPINAAAPARPHTILLADTTELQADGRTKVWRDGAKNSFSFNVYPPAVKYDTWRRWLDSSAATKNLRDGVRGAWLKANANMSKDGTGNVEPDDPGVRSVQILAVCRYTGDGTPLPAPIPLTPLGFPGIGTYVSATPLTAVQAKPWTITVTTAAGNTLQPQQPDTGSRTFSIGVPKGQVWEFLLRPLADVSDEAKFHATIWPHVSNVNAAYTEAHGEVRLRVEVAKTLPANAADELFGAMQATMEAKAPNKLSVSLMPDQAEATALLQSVNLYVQRWRWNGRPLAQEQEDGSFQYNFPFVATGTQPSKNSDVDGLLFGDRTLDDRYELPRNVDYLFGETPVAIELEERDLSTLPGALYFRFALNGTSRYAPMLTGGGRVSTVPAKQSGGTFERWLRFVTPCRFQQVLPAPTVRLIVPLTLAEPAGAAAAPGALLNSGLLVLLDDRWYRDDFCGMAEELHSEFVRIAEPDNANAMLPQFGADPLLAIPADAPFSDGGVMPVLPQLVGPVGYTFDTDTNAPLFSNCSFIQFAPRLIDVDGTVISADLSWYFLHLRFRRQMSKFAALSSTPATALVSEWTPPFWAQMLPPANRWTLNGSAEQVAAATLSYSVQAGTVSSITSAQTVPIKGAAGSTGTEGFVTFVLITRKVTDALGRTQQESFMDFLPLGTVSTLRGLPAANELLARLVEVQHSSASRPDGGSIYEALFPSQANAESTARVTRVSPPLHVQY